MPDDNKGISLSAALRTLFKDEELSDVKFEGTDAVQVFANRGILAARSPVFRSMLFGNFAEANTDFVVKIGYNSRVMKSIVEFCLTDEAEILTENGNDALPADVVSLMDAANYFDLPELKIKTELYSIQWMRDKPEKACSFLEETKTEASLQTFALNIIRGTPVEALLEHCSVQTLSKCTLENLLQDQYITAEEITMFQVLKMWSEGGTSKTECEARICAAKEMARHIPLQHISPKDLSSIVEPSDLVSTHQLLQAFKTQALGAEAQHQVSFKRMRFSASLWQSSLSVVFSSKATRHETDLLQMDAPIRSGLWTWSIKVEVVCPLFSVGVVSTVHTPQRDKWLGRSIGGLSYGCDGHACKDSKAYSRHPTFVQGAIVTMTLDLRGDGGTLSAKIDDGPFFLLFSNILDANQAGDDEIGFLPAVSLKSPGRAEFLGWKEVLP